MFVAISLAEMLANVGITRAGEPGEPALAFVIHRAQEKVTVYETLGDDKAPLVRGRFTLEKIEA